MNMISKSTSKYLYLLKIGDTSLVGMNLKDCCIVDDRVILIADGLRDNCTVTSLDLSENKLGVHGCEAIGQMLQVNTSLEKVRLCHNSLNDECIQCIAGGLQKNPSVTLILLRNNHFQIDGCIALGEMLRFNTTLKQIGLRGNGIGDEGAACIADGLEHNGCVTGLSLSQNNIKINGCRALARMLRVNHTLKIFSLRDNFIGDEGTACIVDGLLQNTSLNSLNLQSNFIQENGCQGLVRLFEVNRTLRTVNLSQNNFGDRGITWIANSLHHHNTTVTKLNLSQNNFGCVGCQEIGRMLQVNHSLKHFIVQSQGTGTAFIVHGLESNTGVIKFDLSGKRNWEESDLYAIGKMILVNRTLDLGGISDHYETFFFHNPYGFFQVYFGWIKNQCNVKTDGYYLKRGWKVSSCTESSGSSTSILHHRGGVHNDNSDNSHSRPVESNSNEHPQWNRNQNER